MSQTNAAGWSLSEVQSMATKAARGSGLDWSLAEACGRGTRWLCAQGLDGVAIAVAALVPDHPLSQKTPIDTPEPPDVPVACPIRTGTWATDRAHLLADVTQTETPVRSALMLLPFAGQIAQIRQTSVGVMLSDGLWSTDGAQVSPPPQAGLIRPPAGERATLHLNAWMSTPLPTVQRAHPAPDHWQQLDLLAQRTYAPATEASRLRGAGAGTSDND